MKNKSLICAVGLASAILSQAAAAAGVALTVQNPQVSPVGGSVSISIAYTADASTTSHSGSFTFDDANFNASVAANSGGVCTNGAEDGSGAAVIAFSDGEASVMASQTVCTFTLTHVGAATGSFPYTIACASADIDDNATTCTPVSGNIVVVAGPQAGPAITYTPAPAAATSTITFPAATSIGGTTTFDITTLIGAGGANGGETTVGSCTTSGGVSFTDGAETCTAGGACVDGNLTLQCVATSAAQTGTVSCTETTDAETVSGDGNTTTATRTWGFTCPAANVAPALAYNPTTSTNVNSTQVGQGQTASGTIVVTPSGGSGTSTSTVSNCAIPLAGFTAPAGTLTFTGSGTGTQNLTFTCTAPNGGAGNAASTLTCDQTIGAATTQVSWPVTCLEGVPRAAPTVTYGAAPTFNTGATVGATATSVANFTADISGGQNDSTGGAESASVSCSVTSGPFALGAGTASATNVVAPAAAGNDINVALTCTTPANTAAVGVLTCNYTPTVDGVAGAAVPTTFDLSCPPAPVSLSSNPAPGPITLTGVPGATVGGSIVFSNNGSNGSVDCSATAGTANVQITSSNPLAVASGGSASLTYSCTAAAPGATASGSIQCSSNDPDDFASVTYNITCNGLVSSPIPAINDFGKLLMVVLVIGLGLVGLGARRL